jgi:Holliday junction resolvase RusA-like endonuclease
MIQDHDIDDDDFVVPPQEAAFNLVNDWLDSRALLTVSIEGHPVAWPRAGVRHVRGRVRSSGLLHYKPRPLVSWQRVIALSIVAKEPHRPAPPWHSGPIGMALEFVIGRAGGSSSIPTGDVDNYAKAVLDALQGLLYVNDRQVVDLVSRKRYHTEAEPWTGVHIHAWDRT